MKQLYFTDSEKQHSLVKPFDPRTEVSADASKIVMHMWLICFVLPIACLVLYEVVPAMLKGH